MNKPLNTFRFKGIRLTQWDKDRFSLEKSYKPKDSTEWKPTTSFFRNELHELQKLITDALSGQETLIDRLPSVAAVSAPDDDDIPF